MIRLFTSHYRELNERRNEELRTCLDLNLNNSAIDEVCLLLENIASPSTHSKIRTKKSETRPRYSDFFSWMKEFDIKNDDLTILCNSDIYFDDTILTLRDRFAGSQCLALARWDVKPSGRPELFDRNDSQDSWIFRGKIRNIFGDFPVGVPRCDNRILYELNEAGYDVINPAFSIRSYHLHSGKREEYSDQNMDHFVSPPYGYMWPHNFLSLPKTALHNFGKEKGRIGWRFDKRRVFNSLPLRVVLKTRSVFREALGLKNINKM